jgi:NAD(P)H dehydrogenase (quinone)
MKNILVIDGHPDKESFCAALSERYVNGAVSSGANCKLIHLIDLQFDPILHYGYRKRTEMEPDLIKIYNEIKAAEHIVFVYPTWWGTYPALFKGFIDRVFLPGFTFESKPNSLFHNKLLMGKSARLIVTMDAPSWYYYLVYGKPGHNAMKQGTLEYCGIKPIRTTTLGPIKLSSDKKRKRWLSKVEEIGIKMK